MTWAAWTQQLFRGEASIMGWSAAGHAFLVALLIYLQVSLHASTRMAMAVAVLANLGFSATILPARWLSDRLGRRAEMIAGLVLITVLALPLLRALRDPAAALCARSVAVLLSEAAVGLLASAARGTVPAEGTLHRFRRRLLSLQCRVFVSRGDDHCGRGAGRCWRRPAGVLRWRGLHNQCAVAAVRWGGAVRHRRHRRSRGRVVIRGSGR